MGVQREGDLRKCLKGGTRKRRPTYLKFHLRRTCVMKGRLTSAQDNEIFFPLISCQRKEMCIVSLIVYKSIRFTKSICGSFEIVQIRFAFHAQEFIKRM